MGGAERIYGGVVRGFSILIVALGVAMIATTVAAGGGPLSVGVLLGAGFAALGTGRLYIAARGRR